VTSESSANSLRLTSKCIGALLAARKRSSLSLEVIQGDGWELSSGVVLRLVLVNFVHWDGSVDDGWLDGLLLNDRLDVLMDVVVNMLAGNGLALRGGVLSCSFAAGVLELSSFGGETLFDVAVVSVLDLTVLYTDHVVAVLLREYFPVLDGLDRGVVVVLVNLSIDSGLCLFMVGSVYGFVGDSWVDSLVDCGLVLSILREES